MAYTSWSVVFGEQPSAAKWNQLGTNDAGFRDGTLISNLAWNTTALSNPYKFSAYLSAFQSGVTGSTWTKIQLNAESFDTNNNFDSTTNYRYTAPVTGFYQIVAQLRVSTAGVSSGVTMQSAIYKNGAALLYSSVVPGWGSSASIPASALTKLVQLTAGDYLELWGYIGEGGRAFDAGDIYTFLSGYLVSRT